MKIKFQADVFLLQDFEGNCYSQFMDEATQIFEQNVLDFQPISYFTGFEEIKVSKIVSF